MKIIPSSASHRLNSLLRKLQIQVSASFPPRVTFWEVDNTSVSMKQLLQMYKYFYSVHMGGFFTILAQ